MANEVTITLKVNDQGSMVIDKFASHGQKQITNFTQKADRDMAGFASKIKNNLNMINAGVGAFIGSQLVGYAKSMITAFAEAEKASNNLARAMANTGNLSKARLDSLREYAAQLQETTAFEDDLIIKEMALMQSFNMTEAQIKSTTKAALDLAAGLGRDLDSVVFALIKAFNGNTTALQRMGFTISSTIPEGERFAAVLRKIQERFGGAATAELNTHIGQWERFKNQMGDVAETIGGGLLKAFEFLAFQIKSIPAWFTEVQIAMTKFDIKVKETMANIFGTGSYNDSIQKSRTYLKGLETQLQSYEASAIKAFNAIKGADPAEVYKNQKEAIKGVGDESEETAKKMKELASIMSQVQKVIDTKGMTAYEKKLYDINARYNDQVKALKALKLSQKEYNDAVQQVDAARRIELLDAETEAVQEQYQAWLKLNEQRSGKIEGFMNSMLENNIELTQEMLDRVEVYKNEEIDLYKDALVQEKKAQDEAYKKQQEAAKENYERIEDFWAQMLNGMMDSGDDFGDFWKSLMSKMKNYFTSIFATYIARGMTNITSQLLGITLPGSSSGGAGGIMSGGGGIINMIGSLFGSGSGGMSGLSGIANIFRGISYGGTGGGGGGFSLNPFSMLSSMMGANSGNGFLGALSQPILNNATVTYGTLDVAGNYVAYDSPVYSPGSMNWMGVAGNVVGMAGGAYGVYNAYKSGSPAMGTVSGAVGGYAAGSLAGGLIGGAAAGSWGGPIGAAVGAVAGLAAGMIGKGSQDALKARIKRSGEYFDALNKLVEKQTDSLKELFRTIEDLTKNKYTYAAGKYGGMNVEGLYNVGHALEDYRDSVNDMGETSAGAIANFKLMEGAMKEYEGVSATFSGKNKKMADAWQAAWQNIKETQIKSIVKDLEEGIGIFSVNIAKLEALNLPKEQIIDIEYQNMFKFLTDDTLPSLNNELVEVRAEFKKVAAQMQEVQKSEAEINMETALLLSNLKLTSAQLEALRVNGLNMALIQLYEAMGDIHEELTIVIGEVETVDGVFEIIQQTAKDMQSSFAALIDMMTQLDEVDDDLIESMQEVYEAAVKLEMIGIAGEKMMDLPEAIKGLTTALLELDMAGVSEELFKISDTLLYTAGVIRSVDWDEVGEFLENLKDFDASSFSDIIEEVGSVKEALQNLKGDDLEETMTNLADLLELLGTYAAILQIFTEFLAILQRLFQSFMQLITQIRIIGDLVERLLQPLQNMSDLFEEISKRLLTKWDDSGFVWLEKWADRMAGRFARLSDYLQKLYDLFMDRWFKGGEDITGTLEQVFGTGQMSLQEVGSVYQQYKYPEFTSAPEGMYEGINTYIAGQNDQMLGSYEGFFDQVIDMAGKTGDITKGELALIGDIQADVEEGAATAKGNIDKAVSQWSQIFAELEAKGYDMQEIPQFLKDIAAVEQEAQQAQVGAAEYLNDLWTQIAADGEITVDEWEQWQQAYDKIYGPGGVMETIEQGAEDRVDRMKNAWAKGIDEAIELQGLSDLGKQVYALNKSYEEQKIIAETLGMKIEEVNQLYADQKDQLIKAFMQPVEDIIATAGMTDIEKQTYSTNQYFDDLVDQMLRSGLDADVIAKNISDINKARGIEIAALKSGAEEEHLNQVTEFIKSLDNIIDTAGMTSLQKQLYDLNKWYENQKEIAEELGVSLEKLNSAYKIQAEQIINNFWDPVIEDIKDSITSLKFSQYNLTTPMGRSTDAQAEYDRLKAAMLGAKGEDFAGAYQEYQAFSQTYLQEMMNTYLSSAPYLAAYQDVLATLGLAQGIADTGKEEMMTAWEQQVLANDSSGLTNDEKQLAQGQGLLDQGVRDETLQQDMNNLQADENTTTQGIATDTSQNVIDFQAYKDMVAARYVVENSYYNQLVANGQIMSNIAAESRDQLREIAKNTATIATNTENGNRRRRGRSEPIDRRGEFFR